MRLSLNWLRRAVEAERGYPVDERLPSLEYPLFPAPRVAVLGEALRESDGVRCLPQWTPPQLAHIRPMALAGRYPELATVAGLMESKRIELTDLRYPLVVFSPPGRGALTSAEHDQLWRWFHLPVYEQIRDGRGRLLAAECDARDGFHLVSGVDAGEIGAQIVPGPCECGLTTPRACFLTSTPASFAAAG
jgi:hypothetical protein